MNKSFKRLAKYLFQIHEQNVSVLSENEFDKILHFESLLYFNYLYEITSDVKELRNLLQNMHKIGRANFSSKHFELDVLNRNLKSISSSQQMNTVIEMYHQLESNLQLFNLDNLFNLNENVDFKEERIELYQSAFQNIYKEEKKKIPEILQNPRQLFLDDKIIDVSKYSFPEYELQSPTPKKGGSITVTLDDLFIAAQEMDEILERQTIEKPQNYKDRIAKFKVSLNNKYGIHEVDSITINEVCNIIGMVGTGKSTLIHVLVYFLSKNGYRSMVLFETVKDVLDNASLFEALGIDSTAINGQRDQQNRIQKVIEYDEMVISEKYAKHLTGNCYISQLSDGAYDGLDMYGNEPCYKLKSNNKPILCPFYSLCPRKRNIRKLTDASVIFSNINSFLSSKTGLIQNKGQMPLLEYALEYMDVVIFDEADAIQIKLDSVMNESDYLEDILNRNNNEIQNYINEVIRIQDYDTIRDLNAYFTIVMSSLSNIKKLINYHVIIEKFSAIKYGQWFSAFVLINSVDFLPQKFKEDYLEYVQNNQPTFSELENALTSDVQNLRIKYEKLFEKYGINKDLQLIVKFLLALVFAEKYIFKLQYELEQVQSKSKSLPNIFKKINESISSLLPKSPTNNRFGFLYDKELNTIQIFRQQAIGRSAMIDLPYLKLDEEGNPLGPHALLLSGSSFSPNSQAGHIYRPVNYILEPTDQMKEFINNISIKYEKKQIAVSGISNKKTALIELCSAYKDLFLNALNAEGRSLIIVNSYEQAEWVQNELNQILPTKVWRLVPDSSKGTSYCLQRSKLNQSVDINYKLLVAPATAISRGFNIVDKDGHSLFQKLLVLVRPMTKPKQVSEAVAIVNGIVTERLSKMGNSQYTFNELEQIKAVRNYAQKVWNDVLRDYYSINHSEEIVKSNIVASRLVLLMQIIGRLLRIKNFTAKPPEILLLDHAFAAQKSNSFNLLEEIEIYLNKEMNNEIHGVLMEKLYGPFLTGLMRGKTIV